LRWRTGQRRRLSLRLSLLTEKPNGSLEELVEEIRVAGLAFFLALLLPLPEPRTLLSEFKPALSDLIGGVLPSKLLSLQKGPDRRTYDVTCLRHD
jgi:hypothetical protein